MSASGQAAISSARVAGSSRSPRISRISTPVASRSSRPVRASASASRPLSTIAHPASASACAQARPRPLLDAHTIALRPVIPRSIRHASPLSTLRGSTIITASRAPRHRSDTRICAESSCLFAPSRGGRSLAKAHESNRYRTLFLSDLHLGTRGCQAHLILDMLRHVEADTIYLVGDIIDGWRLRSGWYWPQTHNDVVQKLLRKVRARRADGVRSRKSRRVRPSILRPDLRRDRDQAEGDPHGGRRQALSRHPWRRVRRGRATFEVARLLRRLGLRFRAVRQHPFQRRAPGARPALLVVLGLGEAQGQERGQFHRLVRARARQRGQEARRRRRRSAAISITRSSGRWRA